MDLRRGRYMCNVCYRIAPLEWVYICTEDTDVAEEWWCNKESPSKDVPDNETELESLGFSKSVLDAAANGFYTPEQIDKLKSQKRHLHETKAAFALQKENITPESRTDSAIAPAIQPQSESESFLMSPLSLFRLWNDSKPLPPIPNEKCKFQCCHSCRSHSVDRTFISFEAVFAGEFRPIIHWDPARLPVKDVNIMRNLGLRPVESTVPADDGMEEIIQERDNEDEEELYRDDGGWLHRSKEEHERIKRLSGTKGQSGGTVAMSSLGMEVLKSHGGNVRGPKQQKPDRKQMEDIPLYTENRQPKKGELQEMGVMLRLTLEEPNAPSPGISASSPAIAGEHSAYDEDAQEVELDLCKASTSETLEVTANTQLHGTTRTAGREEYERDLEDFEGEVEGGVALTEEAAETCTADIITAL